MKDVFIPMLVTVFALGYAFARLVDAVVEWWCNRRFEKMRRGLK